MSDKNIKSSKQLFSLALILGIGSPFIQASDIKIDEKSFQEMINKKDKEGIFIESNYIKSKASIIGTDLSNKLKDISQISRKTINVIIALKTKDIYLKPLNSTYYFYLFPILTFL